jgi:hypothetical protein
VHACKYLCDFVQEVIYPDALFVEVVTHLAFALSINAADRYRDAEVLFQFGVSSHDFFIDLQKDPEPLRIWG